MRPGLPAPGRHSLCQGGIFSNKKEGGGARTSQATVVAKERNKKLDTYILYFYMEISVTVENFKCYIVK